MLADSSRPMSDLTQRTPEAPVPNRRPFLSRWFWWICALLLAVMAWAQVSSALLETQTIDESTQLVTGFGYVRNGAYNLGLEHPPLLKRFYGLAVLSLNPELPPDFPTTPRDGGNPSFGLNFLYRNRVPAGDLLFRARLVSIGVSSILGFAIALAALHWFGPGTALLALCFYVLSRTMSAPPSASSPSPPPGAPTSLRAAAYTCSSRGSFSDWR